VHKFLSTSILAIKIIISSILIYLVFFLIGSQKVSDGLSYIYNFSKISNVSNLFGASLTSEITQSSLDELILPNVAQSQDLQNSDVAEIDEQNPIVINSNDTQEQIDDILERIDLLRKQLADLQAAEILTNQNQAQIQSQNQAQNKIILTNQTQQNNSLPIISYSGGGSSNPIYSKILISEAQIAGLIGQKEDWVELYNPNSVTVSLANWSIQKHSKSDPCSINTSFYKKNFSNDSVVPAKGFFLVVGTNADDSLKNIANMTIGWSLSENNTVYLMRNQDKINDGNDGDIVDKVGFGLACFPETSSALNPLDGKSIERKKLDQDTDDNSADFRISDEPTPKDSSPI